ncbi:MAG: hypothetical protein ACYTBV_18965, partial [Planctomycetota bacterium]
MSVFTDEQAIRNKAWVDDARLNRLESEMAPHEVDVLNFTEQGLSAYEKSKTAQNQMPYRIENSRTLENIGYYQEIQGGEKNPFGEDFIDSPENRADAIGIPYLSDITGKPQADIEKDYLSYQDALVQKHGASSFTDALRLDMEENQERVKSFVDINEHASRAAVNGDDIYESVNDFMESKGGDTITADMMEFYEESFSRNKALYEENKPQFESLVRSLDKVKNVESLGDGVANPANLFRAANALSEIDEELRPAALRYAEEKVEGSVELFDTLIAKTGEFTKAKTGFGQRDIIKRSRDLAKAITRGEAIELAPGDILGDLDKSGYGAATRVMKAEKSDGLRLINRLATPEERQQIFSDLQAAGEYAKTIRSVEEFMIEKMRDVSDVDSAAMKF